jgi:transcriptional regulator with XRE-family HTH domain
MISSIERGAQDPRHSTLERILGVLGLEVDIAEKAGQGVDRTQFAEILRLSPEERLERVKKGARWLRQLRSVKRAR